MAFPPKLSPLCPEQMTAFLWMCPKLGEGQLSGSVGGGIVFSGQALCRARDASCQVLSPLVLKPLYTPREM